LLPRALTANLLPYTTLFRSHVYMHRMDGQGYLNIVTAEMKARTALLGRESSKTRMNRVIQNPDTELQQIQLGLFSNSGGLPIIVDRKSTRLNSSHVKISYAV